MALIENAIGDLSAINYQQQKMNSRNNPGNGKTEDKQRTFALPASAQLRNIPTKTQLRNCLYQVLIEPDDQKIFTDESYHSKITNYLLRNNNIGGQTTE